VPTAARAQVVTTLTGSAPKKGPSVKEVNDLLDRLAKAPKREDKARDVHGSPSGALNTDMQ
jgi:hypothetical protein